MVAAVNSGEIPKADLDASVLKMLRAHEFVGSEDASQDDGATWRPLSQFPAFAAEIQSLMASALGGLGDLDGIRGRISVLQWRSKPKISR